MAAEPCDKDISQLVADHHQAVYRYAYRLAGSVADAEDLTQQVFLSAQENLNQLRSVLSARNWLYVMLRRRFLKAMRKRRPVSAASLQIDIDNIPAQIPGDEAIDRPQLQEAIDLLPPKQRVLIMMFYFDEYSYREMAQQLDLPIGTVMSRLARAKAHLRARLFPAEEEAVPASLPGRHGG